MSLAARDHWQAFAKRLHEWMCRHEFKGVDLVGRDEDGMVSWTCHKCGKSFRETHGLAVMKHGRIIGPWS